MNNLTLSSSFELLKLQGQLSNFDGEKVISFSKIVKGEEHE